MNQTPLTQLDFSGITEDSFSIALIDTRPPYLKTIISGIYDNVVYLTGVPEVLIYTWLAYQEGIEKSTLRQHSYGYGNLHVDIALRITPGYQFFEFDFTEFNRYYFGREDSKFNWG